jgi:hypothetical protein
VHNYYILTEHKTKKGVKMIDVKQAVSAASEFLKSLYAPNELVDLTLEEVELSSDETNWLITFGFTRRLTEPISEKVIRPAPGGPFGWLSEAQSEKSQKYVIREYKIIQVDAATGEAKSMKIREI